MTPDTYQAPAELATSQVIHVGYEPGTRVSEQFVLLAQSPDLMNPASNAVIAAAAWTLHLRLILREGCTGARQREDEGQAQ